jgi:hypothetical protein
LKIKVIKKHFEKTKNGARRADEIITAVKNEIDEILAIVKKSKKELIVCLLIPLPAIGTVFAIVIIGGKYIKRKIEKK